MDKSRLEQRKLFLEQQIRGLQERMRELAEWLFDICDALGVESDVVNRAQPPEDDHGKKE